jgi:GNAT superfamily N-acetyltransferase
VTVESQEISIRRLQGRDLAEADAIFRLAFGTFLGVDEPAKFSAGKDYVYTRWRADPSAAFAAEFEGCLVGSNFAANWGRFGFFGPLTVLPEYWNKGVGQALLETTMARFDDWGITHRGLYTFSDSSKHIHLYEKFGFAAGQPTHVMTKDVSKEAESRSQRFSALSGEAREAAVAACAGLTNEIMDGLDLEREILVVYAQSLGEVGRLDDDAGLAAFAVCHCGPDTEAGPDACFVKFAAVRPGPSAGENFQRLLACCEAIADERGLRTLSAGVNLGCRQAYRRLVTSGFRTERVGVAMETHPAQSYHRPDIYVVGDWR